MESTGARDFQFGSPRTLASRQSPVVAEHDFVFPERWRDLRARSMEEVEAREPLDAELDREVAPGHPLHGLDHVAIAACIHREDVIFGVDGSRFAVVHLSYPGDSPDGPPWRKAEVHGAWSDVEAFVREHDDR